MIATIRHSFCIYVLRNTRGKKLCGDYVSSLLLDNGLELTGEVQIFGTCEIDELWLMGRFSHTEQV